MFLVVVDVVGVAVVGGGGGVVALLPPLLLQYRLALYYSYDHNSIDFV